MNSKNLANYIENLRYARKLSQSKFVEGITSLRQYQRYRYGECEIPMTIASQMANKLGVPLPKLLLEFKEDTLFEKEKTQQFYNFVISNNIENAKKLYIELIQREFVDFGMETLFLCGKLLYEYKQKYISKIHMVSTIANKIHFPKILKNTVITDVELIGLGILLENSSEFSDLIADKLLGIIYLKTQLFTGANTLPYNQVIFWLAKYNGKKENYNEVIELCKIGIRNNEVNKSTYLLHNFYYYCSLAYFRLNFKDEFNKALYKTIILLELENNKKKEFYYNIIMKDLKINAKVFLVGYLNSQN